MNVLALMLNELARQRDKVMVAVRSRPIAAKALKCPLLPTWRDRERTQPGGENDEQGARANRWG